LQHSDGVLAAFARKQSRRFGDEPVQTVSVIEPYQRRQFDTQRMKTGTVNWQARREADSQRVRA
jgi:hypothetical protein